MTALLRRACWKGSRSEIPSMLLASARSCLIPSILMQSGSRRPEGCEKSWHSRAMETCSPCRFRRCLAAPHRSSQARTSKLRAFCTSSCEHGRSAPSLQCCAPHLYCVSSFWCRPVEGRWPPWGQVVKRCPCNSFATVLLGRNYCVFHWRASIVFDAHILARLVSEVPHERPCMDGDAVAIVARRRSPQQDR